jgi:hypothetical protein
VGAWKSKLLRAALFKRTIPADAAGALGIQHRRQTWSVMAVCTRASRQYRVFDMA